MRREETPGKPRPTFALRLGEDEKLYIAAAAAARGVPTSSFVRSAALAVARLELSAEGSAER